MNYLARSIFCFCLVSFSPLSVGALIDIDFEDFALEGVNVPLFSSYVENGFKLDSSPPIPSALIFSAQQDLGLFNTNGSDVYGWCGNCDAAQIVTVEDVDGKAFSLLSLDHSILGPPSSLDPFAVTMRGRFVDGGFIETVIDFTSDWTTLAVNGFSNLNRVSFTRSGFPGSFAAIDNLVLARVPLPSSLSLMLIALLSISFLTIRPQMNNLGITRSMP
ncbi:MAG: hypothetical protein AB8B81_17815 [Halioglobus sp.]